MPSQVQIHRLARIDIGEMQKLRREALESYPLAFAASAQDDLALDTAFVERSLQSSTTSAIFGAVENDQWVGMIGVYRHEGRKENHRAQLWGMYVTPELRRRGIGLSLLSAAIEHVGTWPGVLQIQLSATEAASDARSLYESAGFQVWGCEPRALQWEGEFVDEYHLVLSLMRRAFEKWLGRAPGDRWVNQCAVEYCSRRLGRRRPAPGSRRKSSNDNRRP